MKSWLDPAACRWPLLVSSLGCFLLLASCNQNPPVQSVQGTVTYLEQKLDHGAVRFLLAGGRPVSTVISPDGTYAIELPLGEYQVSVNSPPQLPAGFREGDPPPRQMPPAIPQKYSRFQTSQLRLTVSWQEGPQIRDFELN